MVTNKVAVSPETPTYLQRLCHQAFFQKQPARAVRKIKQSLRIQIQNRFKVINYSHLYKNKQHKKRFSLGQKEEKKYSYEFEKISRIQVTVQKCGPGGSST